MPARSKFTAEARKAILEAKRVGASDATAAAIGHIDPATLVRWKDRGKDAEEGTSYRQFWEDFQEAEAHPKMRALGVIYKEMPDNPTLAWKFIERREKGYAPPMPQGPPAPQGPVIIQLGLSDGRPALASTTIEVADVQDIEPGATSAD